MAVEVSEVEVTPGSTLGLMSSMLDIVDSRYGYRGKESFAIKRSSQLRGIDELSKDERGRVEEKMDVWMAEMVGRRGRQKAVVGCSDASAAGAPFLKPN